MRGKSVDEWRLYWTPEEYADMREQMSPEELAEEMDMRRAKHKRLLAAREMGFDEAEAALAGAIALTIAVRGEEAEAECRTGDVSGQGVRRIFVDGEEVWCGGLDEKPPSWIYGDDPPPWD